MDEQIAAWRNATMTAALEAVDRGWCIIPLSLDSKKPLIQWKKYQDEAPDYETVENWFLNGVETTGGLMVKNFNIALVTGIVSGVVVLDCDNEEAVKYAEKKGLTSPFVVNTARGKHFYFKHPGHGLRFANKVGGTSRDWPNLHGLDLRGDGGYVVMPPSIKLTKDGKVAHVYSMEVGVGLDLDDLDMFLWQGAPTSIDEVAAQSNFSFDTLDLTNIKIANPDDTLPVEDQVARKVAHLGRKLAEGDGTDVWMVKFVGQKVRQGFEGEELWKAVNEFNDKYFDNSGYSARDTEIWLQTKIRSVTDMDRRQYPEDYDKNGERKKPETREAKLGRLVPIKSGDVNRLIDTLGETSYWSDPVIPAGTITQVVGYNGHGKSFFLQGMLVSMAAGKQDFGPFGTGKPPKVFYMDYDNPSRTVLYRFRNFINMFGDCGDLFNVWSPSLISAEDGGEMNLATEQGFRLLGDWLEVIKPDVVVIDTVRNAFGGLEEASASEWFKVNHVARNIRTKFGASVVLVHHRNKPGESGLGREAGSTAQLTDIDTQVMVTQVFREKSDAKNKAGLWDNDLMIHNFKGEERTPCTFLEERLQPDSRLRMVQQISFGKVRNQTEMHRTYYIGWAENLNTGQEYVVHTPSPKQMAVWLKVNKGMSIDDIAKKLMIPKYELKPWIGDD